MKASRSVSTRDQLDWEARWGKFAAAAGALSVTFSVGAQIYVGSQIESRPDADHTRELLPLVDANGGAFVTGAVLTGIGTLLLAIVLWYLFNAVRARKPDLPKVALVLAFVGPVLLAIAGLLVQIDLVDRAADFVASGDRNEQRADDLIADRSAFIQSVGLSGALAMAFAIVMISRSAMRVGLLSRFMGVLGIVVGALYVLGLLFPLGSDLIRLFWSIALAMLFLGWWPGGRGPAWETGEAIEWPSRAERQRALMEEHVEESPVIANGDVGEPDVSASKRSSRKRKRR